jgi:acyl carrier protein
MEDVPKNAAGKPLRIKLGQRLGIGCLSDTVPPHMRHFEAEVPNKEAALTVPIACSRVTVDPEHTKRAMLDVKGARDVALRLRSDGSHEAFIAIDPTYESHLDAGAIKSALAQSLHDYAIPQYIHIFTRPLPKTAQGHVDFRFLEEEIERANISSMSPRALVIRDIVAELLLAEPSTITGASDFFLLGGNSLLLGRLAYFIRKETGVSVKVSSLFTNSTIEKIAKLVDDEENGVSQPESQETTQYDEESFISFDAETLNYGPKSSKGRGQNHPLSLIVQVIPLVRVSSVIFYPHQTYTLYRSSSTL